MTNNFIKNTLNVIYQYKLVLLFLVLWLHVTLLNLFFVNYRGVVFLWDENERFETIIVHFLISLLTTCCYVIVDKIRRVHRNNKAKIADRIWLIYSLVLFVFMSITLYYLS